MVKIQIRLVLGIDIGTQGARVVACDAQADDYLGDDGYDVGAFGGHVWRS